MVRLLLALAVLGLGLYMLLPRPGASPVGPADPAAATVQPMLRSLKDNGCQSAAQVANGGSLQQLQEAIEKCQSQNLPHGDGSAAP